MIVLGIETSCDETAAALVKREAGGSGRILANCVHSQIAEHAAYGGVVPEIAARAHVRILDGLIAEALRQADMPLAAIDAVAATAGPGLIGGLLVGLTTAKTLALVLEKPFVPINHLEGHALTARLTDSVAFPYLLLLVSGGHTQILWVKGIGQYQRLGTSLDDALGECFDKTAKLLGLPHPGGPAVEQAAKSGNAANIHLPRPLKGTKNCDFSFSGLKTAVRHAALRRAEANGKTAGKPSALTEQDIADICAAFEEAVVDIVTDRMAGAFAFYHRQHIKAETKAGESRKPVLVAAGGVAANAALRRALQNLCAQHGFAFIAPPAALCSDNAAMIAWAGAERLAQAKQITPPAAVSSRKKTDKAISAVQGVYVPHDLDFAARARWPLDETSPAKIGFGRKGAKA